MTADQPSLASSLWHRLTNHHHRRQQQLLVDYNDEDSLEYSVSVGGLHSSPVVERSSLRTLELIRQLSFDTSMPKLADMCDAENNPSTNRCLEPEVVSPPLHHVVVNNVDHDSASKTPSDMKDYECGYVADFDEMATRCRLASDQSPYAVSSASITSSDDRSLSSSEEFYWDDPAGSHFDASEFEESDDDSLIGPPLCTRLSTESLQGWDLLCDQEGNVTDKMQYISTALCSSSLVGDQVSSYVGKVYMQTQQGDGLWQNDQPKASAIQLFRPRIDTLKQDYDEAIASVGCLAFIDEATKKQDANAESDTPPDEGKRTLSRRRSLTLLFKKEKISPINLKISSLSSSSSRFDGSKKMCPLSPDRTVATSIESCDSGDDQEYQSYNAEVPTF